MTGLLTCSVSSSRSSTPKHALEGDALRKVVNCRCNRATQASVSISSGDVQQDVSDVFRRTAAAMAGLRSSIWDEYYSLMQVWSLQR